MAVKSRELREGRGPGFVPASAAELGLLWALRAIGVGLFVVSWVGTYYALRGVDAPAAPLGIVAGLGAAPLTLLAALALQGLLALAQWGSVTAVRSDLRAAAIYVGSLGVSVAMSYNAYDSALLAAGLNGATAALLVIAADVAAEWLLVDRRS